MEKQNRDLQLLKKVTTKQGYKDLQNRTQKQEIKEVKNLFYFLKFLIDKLKRLCYYYNRKGKNREVNKMKKNSKAHDVIVLIIATIVFLSYLLFASVISSRYSKETIVRNVEGEIIVVEDKQGNLWEFRGEGFKERDKVKVIFDNNNTETIFDDEIIKAKKI